MEEIHLYLYSFIPFVDIFYPKYSRNGLKFLIDGEKFIKNVEEEFQKIRKHKKNIQEDNEKYKNKDENITDIFILSYGNLKWKWYNDGYYYYRWVRPLMLDNQPIRPLIPIATRSINLKLDEKNIRVISKRKQIEISTILIAVLSRKVSSTITNFCKDDFSLLRSITNKYKKEISEEKKRVLKALFKDSKIISTNISALLTIIECHEKNFKKLISNFNRRKIDTYKNKVYFYFEGYNKLYVIYKDEHKQIFRRRIIKAIIVAYTLRELLERINYLMDKNIIEELPLKEKIDFIEFILAVADPNNYSSLEKIRLLPNIYQRVIFNTISEKIGLRKKFNILFDKIITKVKKMEQYELSIFLKRNNIFINRFKDNLRLISHEVREPKLSDKAKYLFLFFIDKFNEKVEELDNKFIQFKCDRNEPVVKLTTNMIREQINTWLKEKKLPISTITDRNLTPVPSELIKELASKDLIIMKSSTAGKVKMYFYLNLRNEYVQKMLI
ncbi:MAG: hypothetical protein ACTSP3_01690 [Candidatus Heimdallarchaeaceae archaeon]